MLLGAARTRPKRPGELSRWLQHDLQKSRESSNMAQGASKTPLRRLRERPRTSQDASRATPSAPKKSPSLSKSLQDCSGGPAWTPPGPLQRRFGGFQETTKSSPEELSKPPAIGLQPPTSGLQVASAGCAKRKQLTSHRAPECPRKRNCVVTYKLIVLRRWLPTK